MTEHAAVVFVFFFLAEYGSIVLMCILSSILFLGGYLGIDILNIINLDLFFNSSYYLSLFMYNSIFEGLFSGLNLGLKSSVLIFIFI